MTGGIFVWWAFLISAAGFNIVAWWLATALLARRRPAMSADAHGNRRLQLALSAVYVLGCAFRSAFPVYDVPRLCLFDTWASSALVGRSVATIAEICFVAQWALLLREYSRSARSDFAAIASQMLVPMIGIAEICSWYSVLTTSNLGHVLEESIWAISAALMVAGMWAIRPQCSSGQRAMLAAGCVAGALYVAFMFAVDVPMYWSRLLADEAGGRHVLGLASGLTDMAQRRVVSHRWQDWRSEVVWMSLYFSVALWISIGLAHAPLPDDGSARRGRNRLPLKNLGGFAADRS